MKTDELITPIDAARIIGIKVQTLALWRCYQSVNLPFYRGIDGKKIFYKREQVEAFAKARREKEDLNTVA